MMNNQPTPDLGQQLVDLATTNWLVTESPHRESIKRLIRQYYNEALETAATIVDSGEGVAHDILASRIRTAKVSLSTG